MVGKMHVSYRYAFAAQLEVIYSNKQVSFNERGLPSGGLTCAMHRGAVGTIVPALRSGRFSIDVLSLKWFATHLRGLNRRLPRFGFLFDFFRASQITFQGPITVLWELFVISYCLSDKFWRDSNMRAFITL